jgi:alpha-ketoglutarate-dependent taurine dioxygenase
MTIHASIQALSFAPDRVRIEWSDGICSEFTSLWLLDNDPVHRDPHSGQRLIDVADLPEEPRILHAALQGSQLLVGWEGGEERTSISVDWLARQRDRPAPGSARAVTLWGDAAGMDAHRDFAWLSLDELRAGRAPAAAWFGRLGKEGLAFVSAVPAREGAILDAVSPIGIVQETNYGRLFDVRSVARPENLAYSDLGLGLHTDNPYRDPVPGFQVLHCILPANDGGDSLFADGYAIAEHLRRVDPEAFAVLSQNPVPFHYRSRDADLYAEQRLIELGMRDEIVAVHYNNRSIGPLPLAGPDLTVFYEAYRRFAQLLRVAAFCLRMRMQACDLVVFDNRRVLHARTSFSAARHLQGCYLTKDSVYSRVALMREEP